MPNAPELHFVRGPTKSLSTTIQIGASGKTVQKKRHNLTGHNSPVWLTKTFFTWSVSDEFAVKCEQFSISRCHKTAILIYHDKYDIANRYIKKSIISDICRRSEFRHRIFQTVITRQIRDSHTKSELYARTSSDPSPVLLIFSMPLRHSIAKINALNAEAIPALNNPVSKAIPSITRKLNNAPGEKSNTGGVTSKLPSN